jgi:hypothetical protein
MAAKVKRDDHSKQSHAPARGCGFAGRQDQGNEADRSPAVLDKIDAALQEHGVG